MPKQPSPTWAAGTNKLAQATAGVTIHAIFRKGRDPKDVPEPSPEPSDVVENESESEQVTPQTEEKTTEKTKQPELDHTTREQAVALAQKVKHSGLPDVEVKKFNDALRMALTGNQSLLPEIERRLEVAIQNHALVKTKAQQLQQKLQNPLFSEETLAKFNRAITHALDMDLSALERIEQLIDHELVAKTKPREEDPAKTKAAELQQKLAGAGLPQEMQSKLEKAIALAPGAQSGQARPG